MTIVAKRLCTMFGKTDEVSKNGNMPWDSKVFKTETLWDRSAVEYKHATFTHD